MKSPVVAVVTLSALLASWPAAAQSTLDSWTCVRPRIAEPRGNFRVVLGSPVGPQTCTVKRPAKLACVTTSGTTVTPEIPGSQASPAGSFLCYTLKCRRPIGGQEQLIDAFGQHTVGLRLPRWLCAPAVNPSAGPTTTTSPGSSTTTVAGSSTTSTTIEDNNNCRFENGECRGSCAAGSTCRAAAGTASCECRNVSCGDADAPECNGACPSPDDACVFTVTSCRCIHIP